MADSIRVPDAGVPQQLEAVIGKVIQRSAKCRGILRAPGSVTVIPTVVLPPAIVEKGKQANDFHVSPGASGE
jgi:hypothetical protein